MSEQKHTPTPWKLHDDNTSIVDINNIGECASCIGRNGQENAKFIVLACNSFDDLVSRLEWAIKKLNECGKQCEFSIGMWRSIRDCEEILAKAKQ